MIDAVSPTDTHMSKKSTTYIDVTGCDDVSDCIDCSIGKYIDVDGSDETSDCIDCVVGKSKYIDVTGSAR